MIDMRIRMTQTRKGSPDGVLVNTYEQGKVYDLPNSLARIFLDEGWAEEDKALDQAPEVKAGGNDNKASKSPRKRTRNSTRRKKSSKD